MDRISGEFLQTKVGLTVDFRSVTVQMCQRSLGYKARRYPVVSDFLWQHFLCRHFCGSISLNRRFLG
jgi:hypothetical protein